MNSAIRVIIDEMLSDELIREIGADHKDPCLCVTRICSHVGKQDEELTERRNDAHKHAGEVRRLVALATKHGASAEEIAEARGLT
jgi:hypothetical protein